jgi:hypothetical protein
MPKEFVIASSVEGRVEKAGGFLFTVTDFLRTDGAFWVEWLLASKMAEASLIAFKSIALLENDFGATN